MILLGLLLRGIVRLFGRLAYFALMAATMAKVISFAIAVYLEHHPHKVEALASRLIGMPVRVARIDSDWHGFTPRIWLRGLSLGEEGEMLKLGDVLATTALAALPHWPKTMPVAFYLTGVQVHVVRNKEGMIKIVGLPKSRGGHAALPALLRIYDASVVWDDQKRHIKLIEKHLDLQLLSRGDEGRLLARWGDRPLRLIGRLKDMRTGARWSARFWVRGEKLDPSDILAPYLPSSLMLRAAPMDFQLWSRWQNGRHQSSRLLFHLANAKLANNSGVRLELKRLQGDLFFQRQKDGWRLQAKGIRLQAAQAPQQAPTAFDMRLAAGELSLWVQTLNIAAIAPLVHLAPLSEASRQALEALQPEGRLQNIHLRWRPGQKDWRLGGQLADIHFKPWKKAPGFSGLGGDLLVKPGWARLKLNSKYATVELPRLFRQPLSLALLDGVLTWQKNADGWRLDSPLLSAANSDIQTVTRLHLSKRQGHPLFADIQTDFLNGDGSSARLYYPVGIMKPKLIKWLDRSILFGRVRKGRFLLRGPLRHFPFHNTHDGHFEVLFEAEKLSLAYHPEWPTLQQTVGEVRFLNNSLEIHSPQARIYNSVVKQARVRIATLKPLAPLEITGLVEGPLADELRLLRETPLKKRLARRVAGLDLQGEGRLSATISIALHTHKYHFDGTLDFDDARLLWVPQNLTVDHLKGQLHIDNRGLDGKGIQAEALEGKLTIAVRTGRNATTISARGRIPAVGLVRQYPLLAALQPRGAVKADVVLDLPNYGAAGKMPIRLHIASNMQGMALALPPPLEKSEQQSRPLTFDLRFFKQGQKLDMKMGGALALSALLNAGSHLQLTARLSRLPLRPWVRWFHGDVLGKAQGRLKIDHLELRSNSLEAPPLMAKDLVLKLDQANDRWRGTIDSSAVAGRLSLSPGKGRKVLTLDLDKLYLTTSADKSGNKRIPAEKVTPDPSDMPLLRLRARRLRFNQADLGSLTVGTEPDPAGQRIETFEVEGGIARIVAQGDWVVDKGRQISRLAGTLRADDMGTLLRQALALDSLSGGGSRLAFDLHWPGAPFLFDLARVRGQMRLDMTAGRFLNLKPGAARVLGLLNVNTLGRRLRLDFSDLYKKGLAFDNITGTFRMANGVVYSNDLEITAPTGTIRVAGSTDIVKRTHDQLVTVSPRLDVALPVAGAVVGGPVGGLVGLVTQKALSDKLEKLQRIRYAVTGSWDDPKVERLKRRPTDKQESLLP